VFGYYARAELSKPKLTFAFLGVIAVLAEAFLYSIAWDVEEFLVVGRS